MPPYVLSATFNGAEKPIVLLDVIFFEPTSSRQLYVEFSSPRTTEQISDLLAFGAQMASPDAAYLPFTTVSVSQNL